MTEKRSAAAIVVAALFGLAGVGAAVAMVVATRSAPAGRETARETVEATVEAWRAGDGDRVVALMPSYAELAAALDCPRVEEEDARENHGELRTQAWAKARVWKQRRPRVRGISPGEVKRYGVDEAIGRCRTIRPVALQRQEVTIEVDGGGHGQHDVSMTVIELGGRWFVMETGDVSRSEEDDYEHLVTERRAREARKRLERRRRARDFDDSDALADYSESRGRRRDHDTEDSSLWAAIGGQESRRVGKLRELRAAACACKDRDCIVKVQDALTRFEADTEDTDDSGTPSDRVTLTQLRTEISECRRALFAATAPRTGIPECDEYMHMVDWYMQCDAIPQAARDGMKQGIDAMQQAWTDAANLPDDARGAMGQGCLSAVEAIRQSGRAMGCGSPP